MPILEAIHVVKRFRIPKRKPGLWGATRHLFYPRFETKAAVDGVDLQAESGERIAYLGPNGAGKSTTIKLLSGILVPTEGSVRVCGLVPHRERLRHAANIGVVFGQ